MSHLYKKKKMNMHFSGLSSVALNLRRNVYRLKPNQSIVQTSTTATHHCNVTLYSTQPENKNEVIEAFQDASNPAEQTPPLPIITKATNNKDVKSKDAKSNPTILQQVAFRMKMLSPDVEWKRGIKRVIKYRDEIDWGKILKQTKGLVDIEWAPILKQVKQFSPEVWPPDSLLIPCIIFIY